MNDDVEFLRKVNELFRFRILSGSEVIGAAIERELQEHELDPRWIKEHFSELVESVQGVAYQIYLASEKAAAGQALKETIEFYAGHRATVETVLNVVEKHVHALDKFFLGLTQGRRARAGSAFEVLVRKLFTLTGYPYSAKPKIDGNPDFVLPSREFYLRNPLNCIVFTVKRTLRERWRQIVTEGAKARGFYLATIDEKVRAVDIDAMQRQKIFLVVPKRLKAGIPAYAIAGNVIGFDEFLVNHVDAAKLTWPPDGRLL